MDINAIRQHAARIIDMVGIEYARTHKIQIIKAVRSTVMGHNLGLKESKDAVEWVFDSPNVFADRTRTSVGERIERIERTQQELTNLLTLLKEEKNNLDEPEEDMITWASYDSSAEMYKNNIAIKTGIDLWQVTGKAGHYTWNGLKDAFPVLRDGYYPLKMQTYKHTATVVPF